MPDGESLYCTWRATNVKWRLLGNAGLLLVVGGAIFALIKDRRGLMAMVRLLGRGGGACCVALCMTLLLLWLLLCRCMAAGVYLDGCWWPGVGHHHGH